MFESLAKYPPDDLVGGVYYAIRIIKHIKHMKDVPYDYLLDVPSEPTPSHSAIKDQIIDQIEQTERLPLKNIPVHVSETYIQSLAKQLQAILKERFAYDERRGDELLAQLRNIESVMQ
jgi:hypothetical protein